MQLDAKLLESGAWILQFSDPLSERSHPINSRHVNPMFMQLWDDTRSACGHPAPLPRKRQ